MDNLAERIVNSNAMIYLIHGTEDVKYDMLKAIDEYGRISTIPKNLLEQGNYDYDDTYLDSITVRILTAEFFIIYLNSFNDLDPGRIKEFVHDEFFQVYYQMLCTEQFPHSRKLIIISNLDYNESIFTSEPGLNARCEFL